MKISRLEIRRWRNLEDISLDLSAESDFLCLVGENGTGKSHLLDLLHFAAHHLGLAPGLTSKRQPPYSREEPYQVAVTLALGSDFEDIGAGLEGMTGWDGDLIFESAGLEKAHPDEALPVPPSTSTSASEKFFYWMRVRASGVADEGQAVNVGQQLAQRLMQAPEVLHLYIDAERVFPPAEVQDADVLAMARQDFGAPAWVRQQAAILTQNLYLEWMRAMLGQQQRLQGEYFQAAQRATRDQRPIPEPDDPLSGYRDALRGVLPHLELVRLDQDSRRLIYNSAGRELPYEELSGGERELAFLVGQVERFGIRRGIFLLDEPELHLNSELLRGWLEYLRGAVETGQVWIATHALEAAEVAGLNATLVLELGDDRQVRQVAPLGNRPALATLAGQLGSPAFSLARSRFLLVEGDRPGRERERYVRVLDAPPSDRFFEAGGCQEVLAKLSAVRAVASQTEQIKVGGFIDRDFRTSTEVQDLEDRENVCVLPVHEIENFFLQPEVLSALAQQAGGAAEDGTEKLLEVADKSAGLWVWERTRLQQGWKGQLGPGLARARKRRWSDIDDDLLAALQPVVDALPGIESDRIRMRAALASSAEEYRRLRQRPEELWKSCFGKESLRDVAPLMGFANSEAMEDRVVRLWRSGQVERPAEVEELRAYLEEIPVLA